jgi:hypothetical protein
LPIPVAHAELRGKDRDAVKRMTEGKLYLKTTLPVRHALGYWGSGSVPLAEVSPTGIDIETNMPPLAAQSRRGAPTVYWGFGPNDVIERGKVHFNSDNVIDLWANGVGKNKHADAMIRFVRIGTLDDFQKAFDQVLSPKSIPDQHPDWPEEVRQAVAGRKVIVGMTKDQAFAVVGTPAGIEKGEEGGKPVETWMPRQDTGAMDNFGRVLSGTTGFPVTIRFVDGKVVSVGQAAGKVALELNK